MIVKNSKFIKSAQNISQAPNDDVIEVVFMGRSNVGKSSLISSFLSKKGIAKSSSTPGKTRLINFFDTTLINDKINYDFRIVDLPGIGYAKVSKTEKEAWQKSLIDFIKMRENIKVFVYLIDSRHIDLAIDRDTITFLNSIKDIKQELVIVYTKVDKLNLKEKNVIIKRFTSPLMVSSIKNRGIDELRDKVFNFLDGKVFK